MKTKLYFWSITSALAGFLLGFDTVVISGAEKTIQELWMLCVEAIPALIYTVMCFTIPESPRWLIARKADRGAGIKVLALINSDSSQSDLNLYYCLISRNALASGSVKSGS